VCTVQAMKVYELKVLLNYIISEKLIEPSICIYCKLLMIIR